MLEPNGRFCRFFELLAKNCCSLVEEKRALVEEKRALVKKREMYRVSID